MEVVEVLKNNPKFRRGSKGNYLKENIYYGLGKPMQIVICLLFSF